MNWLAVGALEALFWVGLGVAVLARYWWRRPRLARWALAWLVADTVGFLVLGLVELLRTGRISTLQVVVMVAVGYAASAGSLVTVFLGIETMSIGVYVMVAMRRRPWSRRSSAG